MATPRVMRHALGDGLVLETRMSADLTAKHVLVIEGTQSTREVHAKLAEARRLLRDYPEHVGAAELKIDRHAQAALDLAAAKRARRAARFG